MFDHVRIVDNLRVGGHKAVHVRPYLQRGRFQRRCEDGRRIVRSASAEIRRVAVGQVGCDETGDDRHVRHLFETAFDQFFGGCEIDHMAVEQRFGFDEFPRVVPNRTGNRAAYDLRRKPFSVAEDHVGRFRGEIPDQVNPFENIAQFVQQFIQPVLNSRPVFGQHDLFDEFVVAGDHGRTLGHISFVAGSSQTSRKQQLIRYASQGRYHYDHILGTGFHDFLYLR